MGLILPFFGLFCSRLYTEGEGVMEYYVEYGVLSIEFLFDFVQDMFRLCTSNVPVGIEMYVSMFSSLDRQGELLGCDRSER